MDGILKELSDISVDNLRHRLQKYGESVGPITSTTKSLFVKKLARRIYAERYPDSVPTGDNGETVGKQISAGPDRNQVSCQSTPANDRFVPDTNPCTETYYGVSLPVDMADSDDLKGSPLVFTDSASALKAVKMYKGSRFKTFKSRQEAEQFSKTLVEQTFSPMKSSLTDFGLAPSVESIAYKTPKMPELVCMRKMIEKGDEEMFSQTVWSNPRYLISSGDTPVILQEGFRYNALHVAAKNNQPDMCRLILETIQNIDFIKTLYPMDSDMTSNNRLRFITDLYLNMPDKGFCESPLHFACKFGYVDVVEVLTSHPITDRNLLNKHGESPAQITCARCTGDNKAKIDKIKSLLEGSCFVPLWRSEDNCTQPVIGEPWSPESVQKNVGHSHSPRDPQLVLRACAGPMSPSMADAFHRRWTTSPSGSPDHVKRRLSEIRKEDYDKGVERIGRKLAHDLNVPWKEYWHFLKAYVDLRSPQGLTLLNSYLREQHLKLFPEECSAEESRLLEKNLKNSSMKEHETESPNILDFSSDVFMDTSNEAHPTEALAELDLRYERSDCEPRRKKGSSSSSGSSDESNYSSCVSGSSDDDEFHNSLDSISQPHESSAVFVDQPPDHKTQTDNRAKDLQQSPRSGGDYSSTQYTVDQSSLPGAFTSYRCAISSNTDHDSSLDKSSTSELSPERQTGGSPSNTQSSNEELTSAAVDEMVASLVEAVETKLVISLTEQESDSKNNLPCEGLAAGQQTECLQKQKLNVNGAGVERESLSTVAVNSVNTGRASGFDSPGFVPAQRTEENTSLSETPSHGTQIPRSQGTPNRTPVQKFMGRTPQSHLPYLPQLHPRQGGLSRLTSQSSPCYQSVFIQGKEASKLDVDVLRALEDLHIEPQQHPYISRWKKLVTSFDENARQNWPTPARLGAKKLSGSARPLMSSPVLRLQPPSLTSPVSPFTTQPSAQRTAPPRLNLLEELQRSSDEH